MMKGLEVQSAWSRIRALVTVAGLALPACASPNTNHYVIASTGTVIGVEVAQNPANQSPQAKLGYNRSELALVPTSRPPCAINSDDTTVTCGEIKGPVKDVPDVLMELRYGGIFDLGASSGIYQRLAVGSTAVSQPGATLLFAKDSDGSVGRNTAEVANIFSEAQTRTAILRNQISDVIAHVRSEEDPNRVDSQKLAALIQTADLDQGSNLVAQLRSTQNVSDLQSLLEIPGREQVVQALLEALPQPQ